MHRFGRTFPKNQFEKDVLVRAVCEENLTRVQTVNALEPVHQFIDAVGKLKDITARLRFLNGKYSARAFCEVCKFELAVKFHVDIKAHTETAGHKNKIANAFGTVQAEFEDDLLEFILGCKCFFIDLLFVLISHEFVRESNTSQMNLSFITALCHNFLSRFR